jgi:3-hydroxyisobutyrate dehydrogenase-like beta-hydroxyacid dehydrogenase
VSALGLGDHYHPIVVRWFERGANLGAWACTDPRAYETVASVARKLAADVAAVQTLVSAEAIRVLARVGVGPHRAPVVLQQGSARNDFLRALLAGGASPTTRAAAIAADLAGVLALAHAAGVRRPTTRPHDTLLSPTSSVTGSRRMYGSR